MKIHVFDTIGPDPVDSTQVIVHCGKSLTIKPLEGQGSVEKCRECFEKSQQFMATYPNLVVHTIFVGEEPEPKEEVTVIISKNDWPALLRGDIGILEVTSPSKIGALMARFGMSQASQEKNSIKVRITPV